MKRKLIFELDINKGELVISDENKEIVHWKNLGLIEMKQALEMVVQDYLIG